MADLAHFEGLDGGLAVEEPLFFCEPVPAPGPDPRLWPEEERQAAFIAYIKKTGTPVTAAAIRNEGKRGFKEQRAMKRTGLRAGAFDTVVFWDYRDATSADCPQSVASIEFKGFDAKGKPGTLSQPQIVYGNELFHRGHAVGCFYTASAALDFLRGLGAPIRGKINV